MNILVSALFYLVILYLSINLLGFFVRGLFKDPELEKLESGHGEFIKNEVERLNKANIKINIVAVIFLIIYFYALVHFWNFGVLLSALVIMAGRLPDLLWEIKKGKKLTYGDAIKMPHNALFYLTAAMPFIAFPILFYSLYYL